MKSKDFSPGILKNPGVRIETDAQPRQKFRAAGARAEENATKQGTARYDLGFGVASIRFTAAAAASRTLICGSR
jgi:hypothetical protein